MGEITGRSPVKAKLARVKDGEVAGEYHFQFNPTQRSRSRSVQHDYAVPGGGSLPIAYFLGCSGDVISFTLLLDATRNYSDAKQGVRAQKAFLELLTQPDVDDYIESIGQFIETPMVWYEMGGVAWPVKVNKMDDRDVRFNTFGYETRTYIDVELQSIYTNDAAIRTQLLRLKALRAMVEAPPQQ